MTSCINYKDAFFELANLTVIHGEPTIERLNKFQNYIKTNTKSVYSNMGGGAHDHIGPVLNDTQNMLISPTIFVYTTHPGLIIIPDSTIAHSNSNMQIVHTKKVLLFREVT